MTYDIDDIYGRADLLLRSIYTNYNLSSELKEDTRWMKYIELNAVLDTDGTFTLTNNSTTGAISQYEEVIIRLTISASDAYDAYCPIIYISGPNDPDVGTANNTYSDSNYESNFQYRLHMLPVGVGVYEIHLNEILGRDLNIGTKNTCTYVIEILAHNPTSDEYEEIHQQLIENTGSYVQLYATNLDYSTKIDDLSNAYVVLNNLSKKLEELSDE